MPAARSFSYEYLKRLVQEHPDWTHHEYADALTREARERLRDPGYPRIRPNTVAAALSRYRDTWLEQGVVVAPRRGGERVLPWKNIPEAHWMDTKLRRLRTWERIKAGEQDIEPRQRRLAEQFARRLRDLKRVVDLTPSGRPVERPARPDEIDGTGELLSLYARNPGLSDREWEGMTPLERQQNSAYWTGSLPTLADRRLRMELEMGEREQQEA